MRWVPACHFDRLLDPEADGLVAEGGRPVDGIVTKACKENFSLQAFVRLA
jgi:hypothetical protein